MRLGAEYLKNEPLKEYEERKKEEEEKEKKKTEKKDMTTGQAEGSAAAPPAPPEAAEAGAMNPDGMMSGVVPRSTKGDDKKPLLPVTHWGRYVKILLSSTEFMFIN